MSGKRLALYVCCAVVTYLVGIFVVKPLLPDPQLQHLNQVSAHIKSIEPAWQQFKSTNDGFELVTFRQYTGGDGMFQVSGYVTSQVRVAKLLDFLSATHTPRPLYTNYLKIVDTVSYQDYLIRTNNLQSPHGESTR